MLCWSVSINTAGETTVYWGICLCVFVSRQTWACLRGETRFHQGQCSTHALLNSIGKHLYKCLELDLITFEVSHLNCATFLNHFCYWIQYSAGWSKSDDCQLVPRAEIFSEVVAGPRVKMLTHVMTVWFTLHGWNQTNAEIIIGKYWWRIIFCYMDVFGRQ